MSMNIEINDILKAQTLNRTLCNQIFFKYFLKPDNIHWLDNWHTTELKPWDISLQVFVERPKPNLSFD